MRELVFDAEQKIPSHSYYDPLTNKKQIIKTLTITYK